MAFLIMTGMAALAGAGAMAMSSPWQRGTAFWTVFGFIMIGGLLALVSGVS